MSSSKIIGCGLLFAMCLISASMAQDELQDRPMQPTFDQEELLENVEGLMRGIQSMLDHGKEEDSENANMACRCRGLRCQCCRHFRVPRFNFNAQCCLTITYLKRNYGFRTVLICGRKTYFSKEVSLRNPPPICVGLPIATKGAAICIQLSDLSAGKRCAHGCATLSAKVLYSTVARVGLGCFDLCRRHQEAAEPEIAMEPPSSYDPSTWIETQQDAAAVMPSFQDDVVMMEKIGQPL